MPLAEPFESRLTRFQKLLILRCFRPDRVLAGVQDFVAAQLGAGFIEPPPFDLAACFKESTAATPLVFVLSSGEKQDFYSQEFYSAGAHALLIIPMAAACSLIASCSQNCLHHRPVVCLPSNRC